MKAKISQIILWPKQSGKKPRVIKFAMRGVEVITGQSQTGKSSLISIIDYCLGSEKCTIPVGEIRDAAEWFGVVLKFPKSEMLLARRNPGLHGATNEMYLEEAPVIVLRDEVESNSSDTAVVNRLNQLANLPTLPLADSAEPGFGGRPSFRDTAAFQFQPQHVVANPYTLFFKADTFEHQEKLKHFFPFVLGAIDTQTLEFRRQLRGVDGDLKLKRDQLEERRARSNEWLADFRSMYSQAREFGLMPGALDPGLDWAVESFVAVLRPVPLWVEKHGLPQVERGATTRMAREINALRREEETIAQSIDDRKRKLTKVEHLRSSSGKYGEALAVQSGRLGPISWFSQRLQQTHQCPVCGNDSEKAAKEVQRLAEHARRVEGSIGTIEAVTDVLDKENAVLGEQIQKLENDLAVVRKHLDDLESKSEEVRKQRQTTKDVYTFVGSLKEALKNYAAADKGGALAEAIKKLEARARELRSKVDQDAINRKQETALASISRTTRHYAEILGVEHPERAVKIDIRNLTLVVEGPQGRKDHLWEIGSGANWMGYHLAVVLALHEHFLSVSHNPVPQFLVIDQPSQAFFPEGSRPAKPTAKKSPASPEPSMSSDDIARVNQIFAALAEAVRRTKNRLQIVMIDHADEMTWQGISEVHVIERWRGGAALVPQDWLAAARP